MKNKNAAIISWTPQGEKLAKTISDYFAITEDENGWEVCLVHRPKPFRVWMKEYFQSLDVLVFIGAMGIIVRDMAPFLKSKLTDPAVVVLDEKGQFVISVLSGHIGGANELTRKLAAYLQAVPVVTTSSDVNKKIAIDMFAKNNDLYMTSMENAKLCAAEIVSGGKVCFECQGKVYGKLPDELSASLEQGSFKVIVSPWLQKTPKTILHLVPKAFVIGIGCKKGTSEEIIAERILEELKRLQIHHKSIKAMASIDLKKNEAGLLEYAKKRGLPLRFYSADELNALTGSFTPSEFVSSITGVDNVCERSAFMLAKEEGVNDFEENMILKKSAKDGVTLAIMKIDWSVSFE